MAGYTRYPPISLFWSDSRPRPQLLTYEVPIYARHTHNALGIVEDESTLNPDARHCFNCGSTSHVLSDCREPRNHRLIALSRQYYDFFKGNGGFQSQRIHEAAEWRMQRVQWLTDFIPGQVRGPDLREALDLPEGDDGQYVPWLIRIADYGYPKGWIAEEDPRMSVWRRIVGHDSSSGSVSDEEPFEFMIYGDTCEIVGPSSTPQSPEDNDDADSLDMSVSDSEYSGVEEGEIVARESTLRRWAQYPETYFSNHLLFAHEPPPPRPEEDPFEYLSDFIHLIMPSIPPPPPDEPPPPLPPSPPAAPPPLPPSITPPPLPVDLLPLVKSHPTSCTMQPLLLPAKSLPSTVSDDLHGSDMELSDSD